MLRCVAGGEVRVNQKLFSLFFPSRLFGSGDLYELVHGYYGVVARKRPRGKKDEGAVMVVSVP